MQSQPQQQPGAARRTMTLDEIKDVALSKGADKEIVEDSIRFLNSGKSSMKAVLNQVEACLLVLHMKPNQRLAMTQ